MANRRTSLLLFVIGLLAALLASVATAGAEQPVAAVPVAAPSDPEQRVVAYGSSQLLLIRPVYTENPGITRINSDGSVDRAFGEEGTVEIASEDAAVTRDGKILVSTSSDPLSADADADARVTRLLPDGKRDLSFGVGGSTDVDFGGRYDNGQAVALAANGEILLGGYRLTRAVRRGESDLHPAVARLRPDGSLDRSFARKGVWVLPAGGETTVLDLAQTPHRGVVLQIGNEIESELLKLTREGSVDRDFGERGWVEVRGRRERYGYHEELLLAPQLAVLPSGKLLLAATGSPNRGPGDWSRVVAVRLRPNGRIDRSYGDEGWAATSKGRGYDFAEGLALLRGGVLAVATTFTRSRSERRDFGVIAFGPDGGLERQFGEQGRCRALLAGVQEALGVVALGRRAGVLGYGGAYQWLLKCPPVGR